VRVLIRVGIVVWLAEHDAAAALPEDQVEETAQEWHKPDQCQPQYCAGERVIVLKDHDSSDDMSQDRHKNYHQEEERIEYTTTISRHFSSFLLIILYCATNFLYCERSNDVCPVLALSRVYT